MLHGDNDQEELKKDFAFKGLTRNIVIFKNIYVLRSEMSNRPGFAPALR